MKLFHYIVNTNIYISLAAVFLTLETQVQLGMEPALHPYLFIIFSATLFEYNIHRLVTVVLNKKALEDDKHKWVKERLKQFYILVALSILIFIGALFLAKQQVLIALAPIAVITIFYSLPVFKNNKNIFRLREIPCLKIFLIAFVWSVVTIFFPVIQSEISFDKQHLVLIFIERFIFVFAITIPFDIRDMESDKKQGLKTIPLLIGANRALTIANIALCLFLLLCIVHYINIKMFFLIPAFVISGISTIIFINNKRIKNYAYYHYAILDGTMLFQGILVCLCYYLYFIY